MIPSIFSCRADRFRKDPELIPQVPGVYGLEHLPTGRFYVGATNESLQKRINRHLIGIIKGTHRNSKMKKLHGEPYENFKAHVIYVGKAPFEVEDATIKKFRLWETGLNCSTGSCSGHLCIPESRERHRDKVSRAFRLKLFGVIHEGKNLVQFSKSIGEDHYTLSQINRGQIDHAHGWTRPDYQPPGIFLRSKSGHVVFVGRHQIREFSKKNNIPDKSLRNIISGRVKHSTHGWHLVKRIEKPVKAKAETIYEAYFEYFKT